MLAFALPRRSWARPLAAALALLAALLVPCPRASAQPVDPTATPAWDGRSDPVLQARGRFEAGRYGDGLKVLNQASRKLRRSHVDYARLLGELARFYETYAADYRRVRGYLREIRKLDLPPNDPSLVAANQTEARLAAVGRTYRAEEELLRRVAVSNYDDDTVRRRQAELLALIERSPEYPRLAVAYHYLGTSRLHFDNYRTAYRAFQRALELKPGIGFSLPTEAQRDRAFELWVRRDLAIAAWAVLGAIGMFAALLFVLARPWRRLTVRHGAILLGLLAVFWLCFHGTVGLLGRSPKATGTFPSPVYLATGPGSPMSAALDALFGYGLCAIVVAYLLSIGTARLRPRYTWAFVNAVVVFLFSAALVTQFGLRHGAATFKPAEQGRYRFLGGSFYYSLTQDQDPYLLTDPMAYCGFQRTIQDMDEPALQRWFERYADRCGRR